jgi:hypothetical protein
MSFDHHSAATATSPGCHFHPMLLLTLLCLGAPLLGVPSTAAVASPDEVTLADDAYHYELLANGDHDAQYLEWWYFNFYDVEQGVQAIFTYSIVNPDDLMGMGAANMGVIAYTPEGSVAVADSFGTTAFWASDEQADVTVGEVNQIQVLDEDHYHISGSIDGGDIAWDLTYERRAESWYSGDQEWVGILPWERMSWLIYMPLAEVNGWFRINGQEYSLEQISGYHDHNWGKWIVPNTMWNWIQYSEPGLAIELGDFILHPAGSMSLDLDGERVVFNKLQYSVTHTRWGYDWRNHKFYPTRTRVNANNSTTRLAMTLETIANEALVLEMPVAMLPTTIIYEQTSHNTGRVWQREPGGIWEEMRHFDGYGFKEYTVRKWVAE